MTSNLLISMPGDGDWITITLILLAGLTVSLLAFTVFIKVIAWLRDRNGRAVESRRQTELLEEIREQLKDRKKVTV
ncbi:MAG: hypothetical protein M9933_08690 [Chitinophagaceae bacterium]|nr:hypothetical protein [Chitinophagaceae bacterium]